MNNYGWDLYSYYRYMMGFEMYGVLLTIKSIQQRILFDVGEIQIQNPFLKTINFTWSFIWKCFHL